MDWQAWKSRCAALAVGLAAAQAAWAAPTISMAPPLPPVTAGTSVAVQLMASDFTDLYGWQFTMSFNPSILRATSVTEGSFLQTAGTTIFGAGTIDNTAGTVSFVFDSLTGPGPGANGGGMLAWVTFNAVAAGTTPVSLSNVLALNSNLDTISVTTPSISITVTPVPEPGVWAMFGAGLAGVMLVRRRQMAAQA